MTQIKVASQDPSDIPLKSKKSWILQVFVIPLIFKPRAKRAPVTTATTSFLLPILITSLVFSTRYFALSDLVDFSETAPFPILFMDRNVIIDRMDIPMTVNLNEFEALVGEM
eukprot:187819_1